MIVDAGQVRGNPTSPRSTVARLPNHRHARERSGVNAENAAGSRTQRGQVLNLARQGVAGSGMAATCEMRDLTPRATGEGASQNLAPGKKVNREAPIQAARRRRRRASSATRRNADTLARSSRQARRPVRAMAAGFVAASMARRCPPLLKMEKPYLSQPPACLQRGRVGDSVWRG